MFFGYVTNQDINPKKTIDRITNYATQHQINNLRIIDDPQHARVHWEKRALFDLTTKTAKAGDTIIITRASQIARSTLQLLEILQVMARRQLKLIITEYGLEYVPEAEIMTGGLIQLLQCAEVEFISKRTEDALKSRRAAGIMLGRPKGRKNKSRKLDRYRNDIINYLSLNISKASIAKLVGCHPQTLYNYIQDQNLTATSATDSAKNSVVSLATSEHEEVAQ
jgi:DNA invertase Pin-like site-specific DNA recombinase